MIGNAYATEEELKKLAQINRYEITFDLNIEKNLTKEEIDILQFEHYRRKDITKFFIRSTFSRVAFKNSQIPLKNGKKIFNKGDVVIINDNDQKYKSECHIILKDGFEDKNSKYNYVGKIESYENRLIDFIKPWSYFRFRIGK
ncbi:DUF871 domain-containing protein [Spiroplasma taiwanense]|uniref:DUF871 domain-containing protein n=1 Tax=Spiroplasma taiwanense TaxID=2145 RepID=UPI000420F578|nr:DUF871 domain-containing protein [Spiroplasma taiwanense]